MRAGIALVCTIILLPAVRAAATPYLIAYEAGTPGSFPEDEGWRRTTGGSPGATRSVDDGVFTLASDDPAVTDVYFWDRPNDLDPDPGEFFFAEWRLLISEISAPLLWDPGVAIASNQATVQGFYLSDSRVVNANTFESYPIEQGLFHTYRFESVDMLGFTLYVDGSLAFSGTMEDSLNRDFVAFGDNTGGVASTSSWDYFRFGVVPEPGCALLLAAGLFLAPARRCAKAYTCKPSPEHRNLNTAPPPSS